MVGSADSPPVHPCTKAPTALTLYNLKNLNLKNLRVRNAQQIQISIEKCNNVYVKNVEITVLGDSPNTDGIHITNTQNIRISNSDIGTGDDCISIEDGSQNVQISDLTCGPGHGIRSIGSLGDDNSKAYVSGINVDGAKLSETDNGVRIKTYQWIDEFVGAHNFTVFKTRQLAYGFIEGDAMSTLVKQEKEQLEQPSLMDSLKEMSQLLNRFEQSWKGKEDTKKSQEEKTFESDDTKQVESLDGGDDLIMYSNQLIRYVKSYTLILEYPVMINRITAQIYIGRGRILVNCETRFAKVTVEGKDRYRVTMDVHRKVLLERSRFFMEKMKTVVLMYYDDLKKKLVGENVIKRLALLKVSAAVSFDEGVMSCLEHLKAAPWSEDKVDIVLACLDELHLPEDSVSMILHRVSFELKRSKTDDIF
ncbi:hypothetical protein HID58_060781 [Brassica napus]|uniref:Polygalacturonase n=1 Tax=Brassica napus TaxID=3708 RepID=A0ABQ7ZWP1_BRANA|nr:hypothetical protein HID58_060781 [Brassica napus]